MKKSRLLFSIFISGQLYAAPTLICSTLNYSKVKAKVEAEGSYDKFKHCAVSCLLALRCPATEVLELGVIKEIADIFTPGDADLDDLQADYDGVKLVTSKKAKTDKACFDGCHKLHSQSNCR